MKQFFVILYDDDRRAFNVCGPICDDTNITNKTVELQKKRNVRCNTVDANNCSKDDLIKNTIEQLAYIFDENMKW